MQTEHRYSAALRRVAPYLTAEQLRILAEHERMADPDPDGWDTAEAVYWFASYHYCGQADPLYSALCATEYEPDPLACGVTPDTHAEMIYADLCGTWPQSSAD